MTKIEVKRKVGSNLRKIMSTSLAKNFYEAFKELASNSYDADTEKFKINVDTIDDHLVLEDDGLGMDEKGIEDFYRMGDSEKEINPITPKGRKKIGKFGIATVLLEYLCDSYTLETWKNGNKLVINEEFNEEKKSDEDIEYTISSCNKKLHGTKITMRGLHFGDEKVFSIKNLKKVFTWEMPLSEDFSITINNELLKKPELKSTSEFYFEKETTHSGIIKGNFYYFVNGTENPGIYVLVHGRVVGEPHYFDVHRFAHVSKNKITGTIHADGLHNYVSFDRSRFQEDNPAVMEVVEEIKKQLRNIKYDIEYEKKIELKKIAKKNIPGAIQTAKESLSVLKNIKFETSSIKKDREQRFEYQIQKAYHATTIVDQEIGKEENYNKRKKGLDFLLVDNLDEDLATFDKNQRIIYLNIKHPFFNLVKQRSQEHNLYLQFLFAASFAIAKELTLSEFNYAEKYSITNYFKKREKHVKELSQKFFGSHKSLFSLLKSTSSVDKKNNLNEYRLYTADEVRERTDISLLTMKRLITSGALKSRNNMYLGKDVINLIEGFEGAVPIFEVIKEYLEQNEQDVSRQAHEDQYNSIDQKIIFYENQIDYIKNIGKEEPFFLIEEEHIQKFLTLFKGGWIRRRHTNIPDLPMELCKKKKNIIEDIYLSLYDIEKTLDIKLPEILTSLQNAIDNGIQIDMKYDNGIEKYRLKDFKEILI